MKSGPNIYLKNRVRFSTGALFYYKLKSFYNKSQRKYRV